MLIRPTAWPHFDLNTPLHFIHDSEATRLISIKANNIKFDCHYEKGLLTHDNWLPKSVEMKAQYNQSPDYDHSHKRPALVTKLS